VIQELSKPEFVLYRRVSTKSQGTSGLGLEAQMSEIKAYLQGQRNYTVIADLVEVQSGKDHQNRPVLKEAMELALANDAVLLVSRLCRLSRDLEFVAGLMKSRVRFRIATNPSADELSIGIYAVMGMHERKMIATRTRASLAAAKARGVKLGVAGATNIKKANDSKIASANEFAKFLQPLIKPLRESGKTFQEIADILNGMKITTPQGKQFYPASVRNYTLRFR